MFGMLFSISVFVKPQFNNVITLIHIGNIIGVNGSVGACP